MMVHMVADSHFHEQSFKSFTVPFMSDNPEAQKESNGVLKNRLSLEKDSFSWDHESDNADDLSRLPLVRSFSFPETAKEEKQSHLQNEMHNFCFQLAEEMESCRQECQMLKEENARLHDFAEIERMEKSSKVVEVMQMQGDLKNALREVKSLKEENARLQRVLMTEVAEISEEMQVTQQQYFDLKAEYETAIMQLKRMGQEKSQMSMEVKRLQGRVKASAAQTRKEDVAHLIALQNDNQKLLAEATELRRIKETLERDKNMLRAESGQLRANLEVVSDERDYLQEQLRATEQPKLQSVPVPNGSHHRRQQSSGGLAMEIGRFFRPFQAKQSHSISADSEQMNSEATSQSITQNSSP